MAATVTNDNVADADVSSTSVLDDDVKAYSKDMAIGCNSCPLTWWRQNKSQFSYLAKLAQSLLLNCSDQCQFRASELDIWEHCFH